MPGSGPGSPTGTKLDLAAQDGGGHAIEVGVGGKKFGVTYILTHWSTAAATSMKSAPPAISP